MDHETVAVFEKVPCHGLDLRLSDSWLPCQDRSGFSSWRFSGMTSASSIRPPSTLFVRCRYPGAAGATVLSQYFAVGIYGTLLWRGAMAGKMIVPFFGRKPGEGRAGGGRSTGDSKAVKALPLLMTVVSANAAMLLRCTKELGSCRGRIELWGHGFV